MLSCSRALVLCAGAGSRLFHAATANGGNDGAALACALGDMIADSTVDPLHWPIDEMIELLARPTAAPDAQTKRLLTQLKRIRRQIEEGT